MDIRMTRLYSGSWNIAYRKLKSGTILEDQTVPFTVVKNPFRYWIADPIVFKHDGRTFVFAECFDYIRNRGVIGYSEFVGDKFGRWHPVIISKCHLSYPFVFKFDGEIYCIPESSQERRLLVYKAVKFPDSWELHRVICENERFVDTTVVKIDGNRMYAFTENLGGGGVDYYLCFDENFNIIEKREIDGSRDSMHRCAGPAFSKDDYSIRVTQDCREDYGQALVFRKCDSDLTEFSNIIITPDMVRLNRKMLVRGMHTYSSTDELEVIDIRTRRFNIINLISKTLHVIAKKIG